MTQRLFDILSKRYSVRDNTVSWVFWHRYWSWKTKKWKIGPYQYRKGILHSLCEKAGVKPFQFHSLRHARASLMENNNVPIGAIQRILGHENRTTTEIYLHSIGSADRDAMAIY
ncbi:MAG: tyrosine-type recombinase/integrase [Deltaproteobacteria bacterium]|nr:tyrosine-type recombinase/integrase [Deltaproteobacteria bacterium]